MGFLYKLENGLPILCHDALEWGRWFEKEDRHVADDAICNARVSTVFLGIDLGDGRGEPVLWETLVFGGEHDGEMQRYTSRVDAQNGHARMLELVTCRNLTK